MGEKVTFENGRISDFQGLVTLTLDHILHTVMHYSWTFTYIQNVIEIEETFSGRMDGRMDGRTNRRLKLGTYIVKLDSEEST